MVSFPNQRHGPRRLTGRVDSSVFGWYGHSVSHNIIQSSKINRATVHILDLHRCVVKVEGPEAAGAAAFFRGGRPCAQARELPPRQMTAAAC